MNFQCSIKNLLVLINLNCSTSKIFTEHSFLSCNQSKKQTVNIKQINDLPYIYFQGHCILIMKETVP